MVSQRNVENKEALQGVLIVENFNDNFVPFTDDAPFALLPLVNTPIIEYSLDYLSLGGVQELFVFCCSHVEQIKKYIAKRIKEKALWSIRMAIHVVVSETCYSLGDCMRDLDVKGLIRGTFILAEAGAIGKVNFTEIVKKHNAILSKKDKGMAMTMINVEVGGKRLDECPNERQIVLLNKQGRVLFHKRRTNALERKHIFPMEIFIKHGNVQIRNDLIDSRVMVCSPAVPPLFSDNFDFQTKDDFVRGILMNEEILDCSIYNHTIEVGFASSITSWRRYQKISHEILMKYSHPIHPLSILKKRFDKNVRIGSNCSIEDNVKISKSIIGNNVKIGSNVTLTNCYVFDNCVIKNGCFINYSIIGENAKLMDKCKLTDSCIIGRNVELKQDTILSNALIKATKPEFFNKEDVLGEKAYKFSVEEADSSDDEDNQRIVKYTKLFCNKDEIPQLDSESEDSENESDVSRTNSPPPDDTKLFYNEVVESLARGFEDKLKCENLILEINSSRYAYNVTLREVNYNVIKAIFTLPSLQDVGQQFFVLLRSSLVYFSPILENYIRSPEAREDCLQAIQDVSEMNERLMECIIKILNWFYDEDYLTEASILKWFNKMEKTTALYKKIVPFIKWLEEAEEESSSDD